MQVHPNATFLKWKMTFFRTNPDQCEVCLQRTLRFHCWLQYASGLEDAPKTSLLFRLIEQTSDHQVDTNECEPLTRHWISWGWSVTHAGRLGSKTAIMDTRYLPYLYCSCSVNPSKVSLYCPTNPYNYGCTVFTFIVQYSIVQNENVQTLGP